MATTANILSAPAVYGINRSHLGAPYTAWKDWAARKTRSQRLELRSGTFSKKIPVTYAPHRRRTKMTDRSPFVGCFSGTMRDIARRGTSLSVNFQSSTLRSRKPWSLDPA
jgi:hypothetical protein